MNSDVNRYKNVFIKVINLSRVILILGLLLKFLVKYGNVEVNNLLITLCLLIGGFTLIACYFLSIFEPLKLKYDWSLVYPELKKHK